jgi:hypothetical protein
MDHKTWITDDGKREKVVRTISVTCTAAIGDAFLYLWPAHLVFACDVVALPLRGPMRPNVYSLTPSLTFRSV